MSERRNERRRDDESSAMILVQPASPRRTRTRVGRCPVRWSKAPERAATTFPPRPSSPHPHLEDPLVIPRLRLLEIEDQTWCPDWLRRAMTGYLRTVNRRMEPYAAAAPMLADVLRRTQEHRVVDLCSGAGGPWAELIEQLRADVPSIEVCCSDLYPNAAVVKEFEAIEGLEYRTEPTSALEVPDDLPGVRTLFTALHHFEAPAVLAMLRDAQDSGVPFAAFEVTHRSIKGMVATLFMPIFALALMPQVRPRRFLPLLLSYLPPVVPLAIGWDGMVSTLRSYRAEELRAMVEPLQSATYRWTVEERPTGTPLPMTSLVGEPVATRSL